MYCRCEKCHVKIRTRRLALHLLRVHEWPEANVVHQEEPANQQQERASVSHGGYVTLLTRNEKKRGYARARNRSGSMTSR